MGTHLPGLTGGRWKSKSEPFHLPSQVSELESLNGRDADELRSILRERDPEMRAAQLLTYRGRLEQSLRGQFISSLIGPKTFLPLIAGSAVFRLTRGFAFHRISATSTFFSKGMGLRSAAGLAGFAAEVPTTVAISMVLNQNSPSFQELMGHAALSLGAFRVFGHMGNQAARQVAKSSHLGSTLFSQASMLTGLLVSNRLKKHFGLIENSHDPSWADLGAELMSLQIASHLSLRVLGPRWTRLQYEMEMRSSGARPRPAAPRIDPETRSLPLSLALAKGKLSATSMEILDPGKKVLPLSMSKIEPMGAGNGSKNPPQDRLALAKKLENEIERKRDDDEFEEFKESGQSIVQSYGELILELAPTEKFSKVERMMNWVNSGDIPPEVGAVAVDRLCKIFDSMKAAEFLPYVRLLEENLNSADHYSTFSQLIVDNLPKLEAADRLAPALKVAERLVKTAVNGASGDPDMTEHLFQDLREIHELLQSKQRLPVALAVAKLVNTDFKETQYDELVETLMVFEAGLEAGDREIFFQNIDYIFYAKAKRVRANEEEALSELSHLFDQYTLAKAAYAERLAEFARAAVDSISGDQPETQTQLRAAQAYWNAWKDAKLLPRDFSFIQLSSFPVRGIGVKNFHYKLGEIVLFDQNAPDPDSETEIWLVGGITGSRVNLRKGSRYDRGKEDWVEITDPVTLVFEGTSEKPVLFKTGDWIQYIPKK